VSVTVTSAFGSGPIVPDFGVHEPFAWHDLAELAVERDFGAVVGHHGVAPDSADTQVDVDTGYPDQSRGPPAADQLRRRQSAIDEVWRSVEGARDQDLPVV
jgi:hypothetical protein